jgi:hypothetical protein
VDLRRRIFRFRVNPLWYLFAALVLPVTALLTAEFVGGGSAVGELSSRPDLLLDVVAEILIAFVLVNWWGEVAWTGFMVHRLQPRIGPIWVGVVTT